jgi:hypothetical protein
VRKAHEHAQAATVSAEGGSGESEICDESLIYRKIKHLPLDRI